MQNKILPSIFILIWSVSGFSQSRAGSKDGGWASSFGEKYAKRSQERFDILSWVRDQKRIFSEQDRKWGNASGKGLWFTPDLTLAYYRDSGTLARDGVTLGDLSQQSARLQLLLNDFISVGNKTKLINVDLGVEFVSSVSSTFTSEIGQSQTEWSNKEKAYGILFRPFGRSSQDTGLILKAGYFEWNERGLWSTDLTERILKSSYWGAEAKLYLLPFLGGKAEYFSVIPAGSDELSGKFQMQKIKYGAFLDLLVLHLEAYSYVIDRTFTPASGTSEVHDKDVGAGLGASLFF